MITATTRVCIYPKDIQRITGKTYNQSRLYLNRIKTQLEKQPDQFISVEEFCRYSGLPVEEVMRCMVG